MNDRVARIERELRIWRGAALVAGSLILIAAAESEPKEIVLKNDTGDRVAVLSADGLVLANGGARVAVGAMDERVGGATGVAIFPGDGEQMILGAAPGVGLAFSMKSSEGQLFAAKGGIRAEGANGSATLSPQGLLVLKDAAGKEWVIDRSGKPRAK